LQPLYEYRVVRRLARPGFVDVALVRREAESGLRKHVYRHKPDEAVVLFHRTFRRALEWAAIETYAAELARVAEHANNRTLGCFVETHSESGTVEIALYERWFDGNHLRCDELARRVFDPDDVGALVASAEFLVELEAWAGQRNEEREAAYLDASANDMARTARSIERESAAEELARILASKTSGR
jgi:hypothetical protein